MSVVENLGMISLASLEGCGQCELLLLQLLKPFHGQFFNEFNSGIYSLTPHGCQGITKNPKISLPVQGH
jgi:hypothetical protein